MMTDNKKDEQDLIEIIERMIKDRLPMAMVSQYGLPIAVHSIDVGTHSRTLRATARLKYVADNGDQILIHGDSTVFLGASGRDSDGINVFDVREVAGLIDELEASLRIDVDRLGKFSYRHRTKETSNE